MTSPRIGGLETAEINAVATIISRSRSEAAAVTAIRRLIGVRSMDRRAVLAALRLSDHAGRSHRGTRHTPRVRGRGPAAREVQRSELLYRAAYIVAASRRMSADMNNGDPLKHTLQREKRYYKLHEDARRARQNAAVMVDHAVAVYGAVLGWHAHRDDRTTPECRAADGTNFRAGQMPVIGYPGTLHGGTCRCSPGPPFATKRTVNEATSGIGH